MSEIKNKVFRYKDIWIEAIPFDRLQVGDVCADKRHFPPKPDFVWLTITQIEKCECPKDCGYARITYTDHLGYEEVSAGVWSGPTACFIVKRSMN